MSKGKKIGMYLFLIIFSLLSIFPLYYMVCAATNMSVDVIRGKLIPGTYLLENYKSLIANQNLYRALWNSFRNSAVLTVLCLPSQATALRFIIQRQRILCSQFF